MFDKTAADHIIPMYFNLEAAYKKELSTGIIYETLKDDFSKYLNRYKDPELLEEQEFCRKNDI